MNFAFSDKQLTFQHRLEAFMDEHVYPNEALYEEQLDGGGSRWPLPAIMDALKARARSLRLADGPDEVHRRTVAREELKKEPGQGWREKWNPGA